MEVQLAGGFLPLLPLAWLPAAGFTHQISATIDLSVGLVLILPCLLQTGSSSTTGNVKCLNTTQNGIGEKPNEGGVEMIKCSAQLIITGVTEAHTGTYRCRIENMRNVSSNSHSKQNRHGTARQPEESDISVECKFEIWLDLVPVHVKSGVEVGNQTNTTTLGKNSTGLTSPGVHKDDMGICGCRVFITRTNVTDTGNSMQGTVTNCGPGASQTNATKNVTGTGLNFPLCILFGLVVGTLLYLPVIGVLLWQCGRNGEGKLTSRQVAEGNQLSMVSQAAPVTETEDLTYANLKFEEKGTNPTSSDVVYTEVKPSQQKQSGRGAGAANTWVAVFPKGEGK